MPKQPMMPTWRLFLSTIAMLPALAAAACSTISTPASVAGVKRTVTLDRLATAQGKTAADQDRIDETMARGCAVGLANRSSCARHTRASDDRRKELQGQT